MLPQHKLSLQEFLLFPRVPFISISSFHFCIGRKRIHSNPDIFSFIKLKSHDLRWPPLSLLHPELQGENGSSFVRQRALLFYWQGPALAWQLGMGHCPMAGVSLHDSQKMKQLVVDVGARLITMDQSVGFCSVALWGCLLVSVTSLLVRTLTQQRWEFVPLQPWLHTYRGCYGTRESLECIHWKHNCSSIMW